MWDWWWDWKKLCHLPWIWIAEELWSKFYCCYGRRIYRTTGRDQPYNFRPSRKFIQMHTCPGSSNHPNIYSERSSVNGNNSLKVLLAGAECAPFVKLGGLADVMGTLPKVDQIGADARVIMPFHSQMKGKYGAQTRHLADFSIFNLVVGETYVECKKNWFIMKLHIIWSIMKDFGDTVYRGGLAEESSMLSSAVPVIEAASRIGFIQTSSIAMTRNRSDLSYSAHSTDIGMDIQKTIIRSIIWCIKNLVSISLNIG